MTAAVKDLSSSGTDVEANTKTGDYLDACNLLWSLSKVSLCSVTAESTTRMAHSLNNGVLITRIQVIYCQNIMFFFVRKITTFLNFTF